MSLETHVAFLVDVIKRPSCRTYVLLTFAVSERLQSYRETHCRVWFIIPEKTLLEHLQGNESPHDFCYSVLYAGLTLRGTQRYLISGRREDTNWHMRKGCGCVSLVFLFSILELHEKRFLPRSTGWKCDAQALQCQSSWKFPQRSPLRGTGDSGKAKAGFDKGIVKLDGLQVKFGI